MRVAPGACITAVVEQQSQTTQVLLLEAPRIGASRRGGNTAPQHAEIENGRVQDCGCPTHARGIMIYTCVRLSINHVHMAAALYIYITKSHQPRT